MNPATHSPYSPTLAMQCRRWRERIMDMEEGVWEAWIRLHLYLIPRSRFVRSLQQAATPLEPDQITPSIRWELDVTADCSDEQLEAMLQEIFESSPDHGSVYFSQGFAPSLVRYVADEGRPE